NIARSRARKEARILPFALFRRRDPDSSGPTVDPSRFGSDGLWKSPPDRWANAPESRALSNETMHHVRDAIDSLPARQREVIVLRDVGGLGAAEVCSLLAITPENQRVRLHRARAAVRKMLEDYLS